jgi:aspartyl aminopeptidase
MQIGLIESIAPFYARANRVILHPWSYHLTSDRSFQSAEDFITFVNASPSPFHAVAESRKRLEAAGFKALSERDAFAISQNGKYYFTRNQSAIVAFAVGG